MRKLIYDIGEHPNLGEVPELMWAVCLRRERYGNPIQAMQLEKVPVPDELNGDEVLVYIMAAGVNHNGIWASSGVPIDVLAYSNGLRKQNYNYFIPGSEASGIVWKTGPEVEDLKVGDAVIISPMCWEWNDPFIRDGFPSESAPTYCVWGYEKNHGAFAQYARVNAGQCVIKPANLSWADSGAGLSKITFTYKSINQPGITLAKGDPVLVWGGAGKGGQGVITLSEELGFKAIAVVSSPEKMKFCKELGAYGVINRNDFSHWGPMPDFQDKKAYVSWLSGAMNFKRAFCEALGERRAPKIVFEHPGEDTIATSIFMADQHGMVITCGATSGYRATLDLRYLWMRSIRLQGCHGYNAEDNRYALEKLRVNSTSLGITECYSLAETGCAHDRMLKNELPSGNMAILVNAASLLDK